MYEQSYEFSFEAAHDLAVNVKGEADHPYARIHGHSFVVTVTLRAGKTSPEGWIIDYGALRAIAERVRGRLDHRLLNTIPGLERPTLEAIAKFIFEAFAAEAPATWRVEAARPTLGQRAAYYADA